MIHHLYTFLITLLIILISPYLLLRSLLQGSFRREWTCRMGFLPKLPPEHPIWVHAASVGEVFCCVPLLKRIRREFPTCPTVMTTMTRTGHEAATKQVAEADTVLFLPFDHPVIVRRVLRKIRPRFLLIAETELWPNLLRFCQEQGTPIVLFNGRISDRSFPRYRFFRFFFRELLKAVTLFLMQTEKDRHRIIEIGAPEERTRVVGNIKFDQAVPSWAEGDPDPIARSLGLSGKEQVLIAGSTHAGEEEVLVDLFRTLEEIYPSLVLILAPRHLNRLDEVEKILKRKGVFYKRRSSLSPDGFKSGDPRETRPRVVLLDTMGELMKLYRLGTVVFIGGSLVPVGGHNPLEPLLFRKCVLFGPQMFNFREISRLLVNEGGAIEVEGSEDLGSRLNYLLANQAAREEIGEKGYQFLLKNRGTTERIFEAIRPYLVSPNKEAESWKLKAESRKNKTFDL